MGEHGHALPAGEFRCRSGAGLAAQAHHVQRRAAVPRVVGAHDDHGVAISTQGPCQRRFRAAACRCHKDRQKVLHGEVDHTPFAGSVAGAWHFSQHQAVGLLDGLARRAAKANAYDLRGRRRQREQGRAGNEIPRGLVAVCAIHDMPIHDRDLVQHLAGPVVAHSHNRTPVRRHINDDRRDGSSTHGGCSSAGQRQACQQGPQWHEPACHGHPPRRAGGRVSLRRQS